MQTERRVNEIVSLVFMKLCHFSGSWRGRCGRKSKILAAIYMYLWPGALLTSRFAGHILFNTKLNRMEVYMSPAHEPSKLEKQQQLRVAGCLNPKPDTVTDDLFRTDAFFDPYDLVQVKYEMVRRVRADKYPASMAAHAFGFSRVAFYQIRDKLDKSGLGGLVAKKRGPRTRHKVTGEVLAYVKELLERDGSISPARLSNHVKERFGVQVHPRSIRRALGAAKKK